MNGYGELCKTNCGGNKKSCMENEEGLATMRGISMVRQGALMCNSGAVQVQGSRCWGHQGARGLKLHSLYFRYEALSG